MNLFKAFSLILSVCIFCVSALFAQSPVESSGKVKGTVFDRSGEAVIPGVKAVVEGKGIKLATVTDESGEYEFDLPSGIYDVTTGHNWLFPLGRASFIVSPGATSVVNLYPAQHLLSIAFEITSSGVREPKTYAKKPAYDRFSLPRNPSVALVIQFDEKTNRKGVTEYKNVKLSFDALTVIAEEVTFDRTNLRAEAKGVTESVLIDNNGQKSRNNAAIIEFNSGTPVVQ